MAMNWNSNPDVVFLPCRFLASFAMPNTIPRRVWTECCWDCSNPLRLPRCGPAAMCTVVSRLVMGLLWLRVITVNQLTHGNKLEKHCCKLVFQHFPFQFQPSTHALSCIWSVCQNRVMAMGKLLPVGLPALCSCLVQDCSVRLPGWTSPQEVA